MTWRTSVVGRGYAVARHLSETPLLDGLDSNPHTRHYMAYIVLISAGHQWRRCEHDGDRIKGFRIAVTRLGGMEREVN